MKNLKKVLSLVLALAMALSLMTAAFAADASDYTDYSKVTNKEAVDVMSAVGVFDGMGGSFNPTGTLTREQAAKIITYMLMGKEAADKLTASSAPYSDVSASRWSAGAIAYCTANGIVSGVGNNKFNPTGELTGLEFGKMLLVALGYNAKIEEFTGESWGINVSKVAVKIGLDKNVGVSLSNKITREQAAQMALNTMTATMVDYENKGTEITLPGIGTIVTGASKAEAQTWTAGEGKDYTDGGVSTAGETIQFCEQYFPKLYQSTTPVNGQKGHTWKLEGQTEAVSSFVADETILASSTNGTSISDLTTYSTTNAKFKVKMDFTTAGTTYDVFVNGTEVEGYKASASSLDTGKYYFDTTNKKVMKATGASAWTDVNGYGVLVQFVDTNNNADYAEKIYVTLYDVKVVNKAPVVKTNTATGKDEVTINGLSITNVETSKVTGYEGLQKDDVVTVVKMADGTYTINKLTGTVAQATAADDTGALTINGKVVDVAQNADTSFKTYNAGFYKDVTFYYDQYGYGVYAKAVTVESGDYLMVIENGAYTNSNVTSASNKSYVVLADGTTATIDVKKVGDKTFGESGFTAPTTGVVYSYTVNADKTYNLTTKSNAYSYKYDRGVKSATFSTGEGSLFKDITSPVDGNGNFDKGVSAMTGTVYTNTTGTTGGSIKGNADTVYVLRDIKAAGTNAYDKNQKADDSTEYKTSWTAYTGYANVKGVNAASLSAVIGSDGYADIVFIYCYKTDAVTADTSNYVYVTDTTVNTVYKADGSVDYYTLKAIVNGETTTVKADSTAKDVLDNGKALYIVEYTNGIATSAKAVSESAFTHADNKNRYAKVTSIAQPEAGMIVAGGTSYSYTDGCVVYEIAADGTVTKTDVFGYEAIASAGNIYLVNNNADGSSTATVNINTLTEIYIQK